jgi:hypothetical protein
LPAGNFFGEINANGEGTIRPMKVCAGLVQDAVLPEMTQARQIFERAVVKALNRNCAHNYYLSVHRSLFFDKDGNLF